MGGSGVVPVSDAYCPKAFAGVGPGISITSTTPDSDMKYAWVEGLATRVKKPLNGPFDGVPPYAKKEDGDDHLYDPIIINLRSRISHHEHVIADLKNALRLIIKHK